MANFLSKSFITGLFVKTEAKKTRQYNGGKKWTQEERMILVGMARLGATNQEISKTLTKLGNVRTEKAIEVAKSKFFTSLESGKSYYFKIDVQ